MERAALYGGYTIEHAPQRLSPKQIRERAAEYGGQIVPGTGGSVVKVPVSAQRKAARVLGGTKGKRRLVLEEGVAKRIRKDRVAVELGASRFQRAESAAGARVNSYVLPEPLPLGAAAAALDVVSKSAAGAELDGFANAHVIVKLVDEDGQIRYFAASHAIIGSGAVAEAAAKMREWARRYKASRVIGIDVLRLGQEERRRNEARNEGRRIRAREARDRARGIRTTRGR